MRARSTSPTQQTSPKNRHSLFQSPDRSDSDQDIPNKVDAYHFNLTAAIEDSLHCLLPSGYQLTSFVSVPGNSMNDPCNSFHCVISRGDKVVLNEKYSVFKMLSIENLAAKFCQDCPELKIDPAQLAALVTAGIDQNRVLLSPLDPGPGKAVFISGEDELLHKWKKAIRLNYNKTQKAWRITLPEGITKPKFKLLITEFTEEKLITHIPDDIWEKGDNRELQPEQYTNSLQLRR